MAKRNVNLALIAYQGVTGGSFYGQRGEEVDVHEDDLDRFDGLNEQHGDSGEVHVFVPEPGPLDHGAGGPIGDFERPERDGEVDADVNEDDALPEPSESAPKADWVAYAKQEGVDTDGLTKQELIAEFRE